MDKLRFWCQKILPLVYDDSLSYYELLCKVVAKLNEVIDFTSDVTVEQIKEIMDDLLAEAFYDSNHERITFTIEGSGTDTNAGDVSQLALGHNIYQIKDAVTRAFMNTMPNSEYSHIIVVEKNPQARFTLPSAAVAYAKTLSPSLNNRVLIVIASGIYEDWIDLGSTNGIDLVGLGYVIIRSSVAWRASTLVATGYINVANINFENRYTPASGEHAGYALHNDPVSAVQNFWNCTFFSDNNSGVGCGLGPNGSVNFYQCTMTSRSTAGLYFHNRNQANVYGQWLRCYNCYFEGSATTEWKSSVLVDDACSMAGLTNSQMGVIFANCSGYPRLMTYRSGSPIVARHYLNRSHSASDNVFLWPSSYCPAIPGLDYSTSHGAFEMIEYSETNAYRLFYPNAYMYDWTITAVDPTTNETLQVTLGTITANGGGMIPVSTPNHTGPAKFTLTFVPKVGTQ